VYGTFDFGAALSILDKDVTLGLKDAEALGAILPVIDAARKQWRAALEAGMGREDFTAILRFIEKNNGTVVRASA
jgi:3-hydroxyisobutyrate dehydrogenase